LADEFKEILEKVDALKAEPRADHSDARQREEASQASFPDGAELQEAVEELDSEAREYAARDSAIDRPNWFGLIEQVIPSQPIEIVRRPSPNRTGTMILYRCPKCEKPRRYLYWLAPSGGRLVDCFGLQCQACAGFRWASQGRYRNKAERGLFGSFAAIYGNAFPATLPRSPWDPRAVSDPRMVVNEFPDDLLEAGRAGRDRQAAPPDRAVELAEELGAAMASGDVTRWLQAATASPASPSLSGMPKGRGRARSWQPTSDQDQRAIEAVPANAQFDVRPHHRASAEHDIPSSGARLTVGANQRGGESQ
jgi:hypothetical protein